MFRLRKNKKDKAQVRHEKMPWAQPERACMSTKPSPILTRLKSMEFFFNWAHRQWNFFPGLEFGLICFKISYYSKHLLIKIHFS